MSPELEGLLKLQQVESAIADYRARIAAHPQRLAEADAKLGEADQAVAHATEQLKASQEARRTLEKDAAVFQTRLSKYKDQLSAVKTNREYTAMQHEIETAQKELGAAEEKVIERMVEADSLTAAVKAAEAARTALRKVIDAEKAEMTTELAEVEAALAKATASRDGVIQALAPPLLARFEQVAKRGKGVALSLATRDGLCATCHVRLRPPVFQQVRANNAIVQCESCQRILYYIPPPPPVEHPVTHKP